MIGLVLLAAASPQDWGEVKDPLVRSQEMLEEAESLASKSKYTAAWNKYRNIIRRYGDTPAGAVATRRAGGTNGWLGWADLLRHGPSSNRVDVVVLGDGYELTKQESLDRYAKYVPDLFERHRVFGEYFEYHNFLRGNVFSGESGIDGNGRDFDTALGATNSNPRHGGHASVDRGRVMAMLDEMPEHDGLAIVFVRGTAPGTGGGGVATIAGRPESDTLIHEWGHAFGGLGDEYSDDVGYTGDPRQSVNVSTSEDPAQAPWRHWIEAGVKGVGVHQGAAGRAKGAYKPTVKGCAMQNGRDFCVVCREALVLRIYSRVDPIDDCVPAAQPLDRSAEDGDGPLHAASPLEFEVWTMQPERHHLGVRWWVLAPDAVPADPVSRNRRYPPGDRGRRGPLRPIEAEPLDETRPNVRGRHRFRFDPEEWEPGLYRVVARARDDTVVPGDKHPWVLKDEEGLLESERAWWVQVPERGEGGP